MPELTVMMAPSPRAIRCGMNASMTRMVPRRLVSIVSCAALKCAGSRRSSGIPTPDIVTIVSRPGWLRRIVSRARSMLPGVGHVDGNGGEPFGGEFVEQVGSPAADDDVAAGRGEAAGELEADSRGSAGDEDGAVGDVHCLLLLRAPDSDELAGAVDDGLGYRPGPPCEAAHGRPATPSVLTCSPAAGSTPVFRGPVRAPLAEEALNYAADYERRRPRQPARQLPPCPAGAGHSGAGRASAGANRRVPGLRREEVALLAGISADYYLGWSAAAIRTPGAGPRIPRAGPAP